MEETASALGLRRRPALWVTPAVGSPMVVGLLRPRLLLPEEGYDARSLAFIFRHELTHCRRHDLWYQLALLLANAVHWFNPLVWLMVRQAQGDLELTCDDAVVAGADRETRRAYSETLLAALHRQRRAALSTHFYGGKAAMKERFRNIMAGRSRRRGTALLCLAVAAAGAATLAVACTAQRPEALSEEELALWQERVSTPEWYGFFAHPYSDVTHLDLDDILLYGLVGTDVLQVASEEERQAYLQFHGWDEDSGPEVVYRIDWDALDAFLQEKIGIGAADLADSLDPYDTFTGAADDAWYRTAADYGVTYMGEDPQIIAGQRLGDTVTLTVDIRESGYYGHGGPMSTLTMTIQDGKIVSYTNPYYNDVEALTEQWIAEQAQGMEDLGIPVEKAVVDIFRCDGYTEDGYTQWLVSWRFLPEDVDDPDLDRLSETNWVEEQGWRVQLGSPYTYLIFRSTADGGAELVEAVPDSEITFPFAAYVRYVMQEGLTFSKHGSYYPAADTAFLRSLAVGGEAWATDCETVAERFVASQGYTPAGTSVLDQGLSGNGPSGELVLLRVDTEEGAAFTLLMNDLLLEMQLDPSSGSLTSARYWAVMGYKAEGTNVQPAEDSFVLQNVLPDPMIPAGFYLVLPNNWAFYLNDCLEGAAASTVSPLAVSYPGNSFGTPEIDSIQQETQRTTEEGLVQEILQVTCTIPVTETGGGAVLPAGDADSSGAWSYYDMTVRLAVERDSRDVLRTWTFRSTLDQENTGEDYIQALWAEAEAALGRGEGLETHDVSPAIFWDTVQGELYAVSTQPAQPAE